MKYWPYGNSTKESLFLQEIEEIFDLIKSENIVEYREPLFRRLRKCILSDHFQVSRCLCATDA